MLLVQPSSKLVRPHIPSRLTQLIYEVFPKSWPFFSKPVHAYISKKIEDLLSYPHWICFQTTSAAATASHIRYSKSQKCKGLFQCLNKGINITIQLPVAMQHATNALVSLIKNISSEKSSINFLRYWSVQWFCWYIDRCSSLTTKLKKQALYSYKS